MGSHLTGEETAVLRLTFRFAAAEDVTLTAKAPEAYAATMPWRWRRAPPSWPTTPLQTSAATGRRRTS